MKPSGADIYQALWARDPRSHKNLLRPRNYQTAGNTHPGTRTFGRHCAPAGQTDVKTAGNGQVPRGASARSGRSRGWSGKGGCLAVCTMPVPVARVTLPTVIGHRRSAAGGRPTGRTSRPAVFCAGQPHSGVTRRPPRGSARPRHRAARSGPHRRRPPAGSARLAWSAPTGRGCGRWPRTRPAWSRCSSCPGLRPAG